MCPLSIQEVLDSQLLCQTTYSPHPQDVSVQILFGKTVRSIPNLSFRYMEDPIITDATPSESFYA